MKRYSLLILMTIVLAASANSQDLGPVDSAVQKQVGSILTGYFGVKDALVSSNVDIASTKADEIVKTLDALDAAKMNGAQKALWAKLSAPIRTDAVHINRNKEIDHQREHFMTLSNNMYSLVASFKANETESYLQYCPMKKASWLSTSKDIKNPYYGSKMLTCGSVKATLKKVAK